MIESFADKVTQAIWEGRKPKQVAMDLARRALNKLRIINAAESLKDLEVPPGNRLEALKGDRAGQHSIRVNDQWRICFVWDSGAHQVEFTDYH
jgi:proteic killer suppression protein